MLIFWIAVIIPATPAAGGPAGGNTAIPDQGFTPVNHTAINESALRQYREPPQPVTVFHVEVSETSLPGPRYMAFGPSIIDISLDPVFFSILAILVSLAGTVWCITIIGRWGRKG